MYFLTAFSFVNLLSLSLFFTDVNFIISLNAELLFALSSPNLWLVPLHWFSLLRFSSFPFSLISPFPQSLLFNSNFCNFLNAWCDSSFGVELALFLTVLSLTISSLWLCLGDFLSQSSLMTSIFSCKKMQQWLQWLHCWKMIYNLKFMLLKFMLVK